MRNKKCFSQLSTYFAFRKADESLVCSGSFFKPALLYSKTNTISESSIDE
jgi:hypothetical protein